MIWFQTMFSKTTHLYLYISSTFMHDFKCLIWYADRPGPWASCCADTVVPEAHTLALRKNPGLCTVLEVWGSDSSSPKGQRLPRATSAIHVCFSFYLGRGGEIAAHMGCKGHQN